VNQRIQGLWMGLVMGVVIAAVFVMGFGAGTLFGTSRSTTNSAANDSNVREFLSAYHLVTQRSYYRPFDNRHLIYAAIDAMLSATGDPHTLFFSPTENVTANSELNGTQFGGIGAIVVPVPTGLQITAPLPNTPSVSAGLRAGDLVTKINGTLVGTLPGRAGIAKIHGRAGTVVVLTIRRHNGPPFDVSVRRASIPPITAYGRPLGHSLGYIQIFSYGDSTSAEVAQSLKAFAASHVQGIVLDLRQNPGGYVDAAQHVVSQFIDHGVVAYERGTDKRLHPLPVLHEAYVTHVPVVVLVDSQTASAAEITAGALRDYKRATIIGSRTYGKGSMQSVYALSDGSSIRITDRLWLTPGHHSIQQVGILPNISMAGGQGDSPTHDPVLLRAEQYLRNHRRA